MTRLAWPPRKRAGAGRVKRLLAASPGWRGLFGGGLESALRALDEAFQAVFESVLAVGAVDVRTHGDQMAQRGIVPEQSPHRAERWRSASAHPASECWGLPGRVRATLMPSSGGSICCPQGARSVQDAGRRVAAMPEIRLHHGDETSRPVVSHGGGVVPVVLLWWSVLLVPHRGCIWLFAELDAWGD
ncbi:hypothetical protein ABZ552_15650 [Nocardia sp. NPDC019219]|uniref:hypothetical protein n=1 Tax=Nocardia sp. NPDC019219 TaxID=3154590 RepID=UPI0033F15DB5